MTTFIALLRAVNVGGRRLPMADLRKAIESLQYKEVRTYIQSGNVLFAGTGTAATAEKQIEQTIKANFGMDVPTIVRSADAWKNYLAPPFSAEEINFSSQIAIGLCKGIPSKSAVETLTARSTFGEIVKLSGDALWIYFPEGMGQSKLTPALIDKATGSSTTMRNLNTVRKLAELCGIEK